VHVRTRRRRTEHTFLRGQPRDHVECGIVVDANDVRGERHVQHRRDERRRTDAFHFVRTRFAAFQDRALRLDDEALHVRQALAQIARDAGERAAGARARNPRVDAAVHLLEDLRAGGLVVRFAVVGIRELLRHIRAFDRRRKLLGLGDGRLHAAVLRREDDFAAEGFHHFAFFGGEVLGHAEDHAIALLHAREREADAGVARGRLDDRAAGLQQAVAFRALDHADADAILHRESGIEDLHLAEDVGVRAAADAMQTQHRRVADEIEDGVDGAGSGGSQTARILTHVSQP
jgi:hypothetical protein